MIIQFKGYVCDLLFQRYYNGRIAIQLVDHFDHEPIATATCNLPDVELDDDEIIIKNYSENKTMEKVLFEAGVIGPVLRTVPTGFVEVPICKFLI
jgi:hypothetical protein